MSPGEFHLQRVAWHWGWGEGHWLLVWRKALEEEERSFSGGGRDVVTVTAAAGLNQALVSQCSLVTLRDSPKKSWRKDLTEEESRK